MRHFFIGNHTVLLWFVREAPGYGIAALFSKRAAVRRMCRIFTAKGTAFLGLCVLYKTAHCGAAIKVQHFWLEKSGAHAAMFSSAAAARLLHSF